MKILTCVATMLAMFSSVLAAITCESNGKSIQRYAMYGAAREACNDQFRGTYRPKAAKTACKEYGTNRIEMSLRNGDPSDTRDAPLISTCIESFYRIIQECQFIDLDLLWWSNGGWDVHLSLWEFT